MKRIFLIFLVFYFITSSAILFSDGTNPMSNSLKSLDDFFNGLEYHTIEEKLILLDRKLTISVHYINNSLKIFDKAIVYEIKNNEVLYHLIFKESVFINRKEQVLVDLSNLNDLYGFSFGFAYPTDPEYEIGLEFYGFFDDGKTPADPPIGIDWNEKEEIFHKFNLEDYEL